LAEQAEAGYEFEVKLPDGSPTDFYITVRGNLSPKVKKFSKDLYPASACSAKIVFLISNAMLCFPRNK
jgi:hypothetical protein